MKEKFKAVGFSLIAIVILLGSQLIAELLASFVALMGVPTVICNVLSACLYLALAGLFIWLFYEKLLHIKMADLGMPKVSFKPKWILAGFLLPITVSAAYLLFIKGEYVVTDLTAGKKVEIVLTGIFFTGMAAGFVEEMVFRGVIFHLLEKAWNRNVAVIAPSLIFGVVHIIGMDFSLWSCILVIVAGTSVGIMFALVRIESGSVWSDAIMHMIWNVLIIGGLLTISEKVGTYTLASYVLKSHSFEITGGEFGIESSITAIAGYYIISLIALSLIHKKEGKTK